MQRSVLMSDLSGSIHYSQTLDYLVHAVLWHRFPAALGAAGGPPLERHADGP